MPCRAKGVLSSNRVLCFIATDTGICLRWGLTDGVSSRAGTKLLGPAKSWPEECAGQDLHNASEGAAVTFRVSPRLHKVKTGPERPVGTHSPSFSIPILSPSSSQMPSCCPDHLRHGETCTDCPQSCSCYPPSQDLLAAPQTCLPVLTSLLSWSLWRLVKDSTPPFCTFLPAGRLAWAGRVLTEP